MLSMLYKDCVTSDDAHLLRWELISHLIHDFRLRVKVSSRYQMHVTGGKAWKSSRSMKRRRHRAVRCA